MESGNSGGISLAFSSPPDLLRAPMLNSTRGRRGEGRSGGGACGGNIRLACSLETKACTTLRQLHEVKSVR